MSAQPYPAEGSPERARLEAAGMLTMDLPPSVYDIDRDWLRDAIHAGGHDVEVLSAERIDVIHSTCTKARFELTYDRDVGLPSRMILKGAFEDHSERMKEMYQGEALFYHQMAGRVPLNTPRPFWAGIDRKGWRAATLMEDLVQRGARFCRAQEPFDYAHMQARLDQLAALHAQTWNTPKLQPGGEWSWVEGRFGGLGAKLMEYYTQPEQWNHYVELPRGVAVSRKLLDAEWMLSALRRTGELNDADDYCLIHGDTHCGNLFVDADGTPGFYDPTVSKAPWWLEISYFLGADIDIGQRREWEGPLLGHYLTRLEQAGGPRIPFDEAWLRYRQGLVYGLFIFLINETRFQTEATNTAYAARFGIAIIDHDSAALLA